MNKIFNLPLNSTSFGFVSTCILRELYSRQYSDFLFQELGQSSLISFDKVRDDVNFIQWLNTSGNNLFARYSRDMPMLKLWHINGAESSLSRKQTLISFHELDSITDTEKNVLNNQDNIIVTTEFSRQVFEDGGVEKPIHVVPLGFDGLHYQVNNDRSKYPENVCCWIINGKFEHRKRTEKTVRAWVKKFGGNPNHLLHLSIYNNFLSAEDNQRVMASILNNNKPYNVNIHPVYNTLSEMNSLYNLSDIVIDMSGGESWSIPSFTCVALGKHAILHDNTAFKEWSNEENAVLVQSNEKISSVDNMFFHAGHIFNQGFIYDFAEEEFLDKLDIVYNRWKKDKVNKKGLKLQERFTWKNTVDKILEII